MLKAQDRKKYSGLLALACAGFYVLVAGLEAPLVRGYVMYSAALAGYLLDRDSGVFQGLVIACLAILLVEPAALFDAGFQMSFIASYGITAGMTLWDGPISRQLDRRFTLSGSVLHRTGPPAAEGSGALYRPYFAGQFFCPGRPVSADGALLP